MDDIVIIVAVSVGTLAAVTLLLLFFDVCGRIQDALDS